MLFSLLRDEYEESRDDGMEKINIIVNDVCRSDIFIEDDQQDKVVANEAIEWQLDEELLVEVYNKVIV